MSFFEKLEIWKEEYVFLKYVFLNFNDYKNLNFNFPIGIILLLSAIVLPFAIFFANHRKNVITTCAKQLIRHDALGEEKAKSLKTLRLSKIKTLKKMILSGGKISSMVKIAGYQKPSYEEYLKEAKNKNKTKILITEDTKIYLSEEMIKESEELASTGESAIWKPILISVATVSIITILFIFMPEILELINSSIK